ncbi:hypothetical protein EDC96DRAFT_574881 [Choanephora cucurbitarum]|nr:hypothetical protein EDC96DRAFT_574881 [Choanephora cucurbitarum]
MKFSSALISASLLATAVFAAPEPHASASASASQVSAASASAVSAASVAEASIIASMLEATDANASMDITNLLKDGGHKKYDYDDYGYDHHDKKGDDLVVVVDGDRKHSFCKFLTRNDIAQIISNDLNLTDVGFATGLVAQPAPAITNDRLIAIRLVALLLGRFADLCRTIV